MTTAWKRRYTMAGNQYEVGYDVPEDALACYALDHSDPQWSSFDAWASKCRGFSEVRIEVRPSTMTAVLDLIRERARECGLGGQVARLRRELEMRAAKVWRSA